MPELFVVEMRLWPASDSLPEAWEHIGEVMADGPGSAIALLARARVAHRAFLKADVYMHVPEDPEKRPPLAVEIPVLEWDEQAQREGWHAEPALPLPRPHVTSIMEARARRLLREQEEGLRPSRPPRPPGRAS